MRILSRFNPIFLTLTALSCVFAPMKAHAVYSELQTGIGYITAPDGFFQLSNLGNTGMGFSGGLHLYVPTFLRSPFLAWDIGIANRFSSGPSSNPPKKTLTMLTNNIAARLSFWRFYVGGGYAPITWKSVDGITKLKINSGIATYFFEGGVVWNIVPEYQICLSAASEFGIQGSPLPALEYGLRFRFHFGTPDQKGKSSRKWDGWRYPFGIMQD